MSGELPPRCIAVTGHLPHVEAADAVFGVLQLLAGVLLLPAGIASIARRAQNNGRAERGSWLWRSVPQALLHIVAGTASLTAAAFHLLR